MLRIAIELVGSVEREAPAGEPHPGELLKRKTAGNVVEFGSIAAFGFSPLWLLAAASDISHGSRVYLAALVAELKRAGVLADDARARHRRRPARRPRGNLGNDGEARRPAAAGAGGAARLVRRAAVERERTAVAAGARGALRRTPAHGRAGATAAARSLHRHGARVPALGAPVEPGASDRTVWRGLEAVTRRRLRGLRPQDLARPTGQRSQCTSILSRRAGRSGRWRGSGAELTSVRREAAARGSGGARCAGCGRARPCVDTDALVRHRLVGGRPAARRHARFRGPRGLRPCARRALTGSRSSRPGSSVTSSRWRLGGARRTPLVRLGSTSFRSPAQPHSARSTSRTSSCRRRPDRSPPRSTRSGCSSPQPDSTSPRRSTSSITTGRPGRPVVNRSAARARRPAGLGLPVWRSSTSTPATPPQATRCGRWSACTSSSTSSAPSTTPHPTDAAKATSAISSST